MSTPTPATPSAIPDNAIPKGVVAHKKPAPVGEFRVLRRDQLVPSKTNPREYFDPEYLAELAGTIEDHGIVQPITVRAIKGTDKFEIVVGECRWRAAGIAKLDDIPAMVRELNDAQVLKIQIIENLQRKNVKPLEEAKGFARLLDKKQMGDEALTVEQIAQQIRKSKEYVYARLQLLKLGDKAREAIDKSGLPTEHAVLLARLNEGDQARALKHLNDEKLRYDAFPTVESFREYVDEEITSANRRQAIATAQAKVKEAGGKWVLITTGHYTGSDVPHSAITKDHYKVVSEKKAFTGEGDARTPACKFLVTGIYVETKNAGQLDYVCPNEKCPVHFPTEKAAKQPKATPKNTATPAEKKAAAKQREQERLRKIEREVEQLAKNRAVVAVVQQFQKAPTPNVAEIAYISETLINQIGDEAIKLLCEHFGVKPSGNGHGAYSAAAERAINACKTVEQASAWMVGLAALDAHYNFGDKQFLALIGGRKVDLAKIRKEALAELQAKEKADAASGDAAPVTAAPAKKAKAKKKAKGKK